MKNILNERIFYQDILTKFELQNNYLTCKDILLLKLDYVFDYMKDKVIEGIKNKYLVDANNDLCIRFNISFKDVELKKNKSKVKK